MRWGQHWHSYCALPPPAGLVHPTLSLPLPDPYFHLFRKAGLAGERAAEKGQPGCSQTWAGGRAGGGGSGPVLPGHTAWKQFLWTQSPPPHPGYLRGPQPVGGRGGFLGLLGPAGGPLPSSGHCLAPPTCSAGIRRLEAGTRGSGVVGSCKPSSPWHWAKPLIFQNRPTNRSTTLAFCLICRAALWSPFHSWGN